MKASDARNTADLIHVDYAKTFIDSLLHDIYLAARKGLYHIVIKNMYSSDRSKFIALQELGYCLDEQDITGPFGEPYTNFKISW